MELSRYALANEAVDIISVCGLIGVPVPDFSYSKSWKLYCPFGDVSHSDGGQAKAFRVYPDTNSAFCFACNMHFTPVKLYAMAKDLSVNEAAEVLLEMAGVVEKNSDDHWKQLTAPEQMTVSLPDLREALRMYCAREIPQWEERQFEPLAATTFQKCLELLNRVRNQEDANRWLAATKQAMITKLGVET